MDKPTKPSNLIPRSFGGVKNNFSASLQSSGYEDGVPAIYGGDNLNYQLDATGKELDYCETICDYINAIPIGKTPIVNANNKLVYTRYDIRVYETTETYAKDECVTGYVDGNKQIFKSLQDNNINHALTDTTWWEMFYMGGFQPQIDTINQTLNTHINNTSNPHSVTKSQIGLGNCDNTSDLNKPISTATQSALNSINSSISTLTSRRYVTSVSAKSQLPRWYRVWSDGWCEQGGYITNSTSTYSNNSGVTINLVYNFKDTQYFIFTTGEVHNKTDAGSDQKQSAAIAGNSSIIDRTSFKIVTAQGIPGYFWYACGYIY